MIATFVKYAIRVLFVVILLLILVILYICDSDLD